MFSVIVNTLAVLIGGGIGLIVRRGIPEKFREAVITGIGLCTACVGISGALKGENTVVLIASIAIGAIIGTALDLDARISALGTMLEKRMGAKGGDAPETQSIARGFVAASLLFCVGSMAIVGSINASLLGDNAMIYTKSALDFISAIMLAVSLGAGVLLSAGSVFVFQGGIVLLAQLMTPLVDNPSMLAEMTCAGSVLIIAIGLNLIGVTKIKVANYLPAILLAPALSWLFALIL